jgi:hypothetical protein
VVDDLLPDIVAWKQPAENQLSLQHLPLGSSLRCCRQRCIMCSVIITCTYTSVSLCVCVCVLCMFLLLPVNFSCGGVRVVYGTRLHFDLPDVLLWDKEASRTSHVTFTACESSVF